MLIRQKGEAIRITLDDRQDAHDVDYVLVEPKRCWSATFFSWGKKTVDPVIDIDGKKYVVRLEPLL